jgi:hypothetical protein
MKDVPPIPQFATTKGEAISAMSDIEKLQEGYDLLDARFDRLRIIAENQMQLIEQHKADWQTVLDSLKDLAAITDGKETISMGWLLKKLPAMLKDENGLSAKVATIYNLAQKNA